jgi:hypothetical protein
LSGFKKGGGLGRHRNNLPWAKEQKYQKHIEVKASIKRSTKEIIPSRPQIIPIPERPIHDHKPSNKRGCIPGRDVAVEIRHAGEEDSRVPEIEL